MIWIVEVGAWWRHSKGDCASLVRAGLEMRMQLEIQTPLNTRTKCSQASMDFEICGKLLFID